MGFKIELVAFLACACTSPAVAPGTEPTFDAVVAVDVASADLPGEVSAAAVLLTSDALCSPCLADADCTATGATAIGHCYSDAAVTTGTFCSFACSATSDCPDAYSCSGGHCAPNTGKCECSEWAFSHKLAGTCERSNASGKCSGPTICVDLGDWLACNARIPAPEVCNGVDDDCNGLTDDGADDSCATKSACWQSTCNVASGACTPVVKITGACDDGDACTTGESCATGVCTGGSKIACDDGDPCTEDACKPSVGCIHLPKPCDDSNACTADACDPVKGCTHKPGTGTCDDGDACTTGDSCQDGACVSSWGGCDDGLACTVHSCVVSVGCVHLAAPACDDDSPCTSDGCDATTGCTHTPISGPCSTTPCVIGAACTAGQCVGGVPSNCDDGEPCTSDACAFGDGCTHTALPDGTTCTDACGLGDVCGSGVCKANAQVGVHIYDQAGTPSGKPSAVAILADGYAMAGTNDNWSTIPWLLRMDAGGKIVSQQVGGALADRFTYALADAGDGLYLAGQGPKAWSLRRLDKAGTVSWELAGEPTVTSSLVAVALVKDGLVAAGQTQAAASKHDGLLVRADAVGNLLWTGQYDSAGDDELVAVSALADGYALLGDTAPNGKGQLWLVRTDASGVELWHHVYGNAFPAGLVALPDGFAFGGTETSGSYSYPFVFRTDASGKQLWSNDFAYSGAIRALRQAPGGFLALRYDPPSLYAVHLDAKGHAGTSTSIASVVSPAQFAITDKRIAVAGWVQYEQHQALATFDAWGNGDCGSSGPCSALTPTDCDDGLAYTVDACDASHGGCWHDGPKSVADCPSGYGCAAVSFTLANGCTWTTLPDGTACQDACGSTGVCISKGNCQWKTQATCDDGDPCTIDACTSGQSGCSHKPLASVKPCNDDNPCTVETCVSGACASVPVSNGTSCGDGCGNVCTGGACVVTHSLGPVKAFFGSEGLLALPDGWLAAHADLSGKVGVVWLRTDRFGKTIWTKTFGPGDGVTASENTPTLVMAAGRFCGVSDSKWDDTFVPSVWVVDSAGKLVAHQPIPGGAGVHAVGMAEVNGQIVIGGQQAGKAWMATVDLSGNVLSQQQTTSSLKAQSMAIVGSDLVLAGVGPFGTARLVQMDTIGAVLQVVDLDAKSNYIINAQIATLPEGLLVLGDNGNNGVVTARLLNPLTKTISQKELGPFGSFELAQLPDGFLVSDATSVWHYDAWGNLVQKWASIAFNNPWRLRPFADGLLSGGYLTDAWGNATCAESGPCVSKGWQDCSDGNPCTVDRCDAIHGGCFHVLLGDGSQCDVGKACAAGACL